MVAAAEKNNTNVSPPNKKVFVSTAENALKTVKIQNILDIELTSTSEVNDIKNYIHFCLLNFLCKL